MGLHELYCTDMYLPPLVLKARYLSNSAFSISIIDVPEQALGWPPLGLGLVMEDEPSELSCNATWQEQEI